MRPAGPPVPVPEPEGADVWDAATRACRDVRTLRATLRMSARVGAQGIPTVTVGLAIDGGRAIGLLAQVGGSSFTLAGPADRATLIWRDGRVLIAPAADIVDALIGVKLDPARLLAILSGCVSRQPSLVRALRYGDAIEATTADGVVYLERDKTGWRPRAGEFEGLVVDYADARSGSAWPRGIGIRTRPGGTGPAVSIEFTVSELIPNLPLPPKLFEVDVPPNAATISLEELRANGPAGTGRK